MSHLVEETVMSHYQGVIKKIFGISFEGLFVCVPIAFIDLGHCEWGWVRVHILLQINFPQLRQSYRSRRHHPRSKAVKLTSVCLLLYSGERPGELPAEHPAAVLQPAAGPLPGDRWTGEWAAAGEERTGHPAAAPQPAPQHQDEAGARDQHLPSPAGARGGQVRWR